MHTLHIISHTHWDREWYRTFQQFRLKLVHLVDGLLDLLEADSKFKFFMLDGQTIVLDDYLLMRPENEAVLRKHIQKGRILIGPWHILPDMFLVGPEAHVRNLLQGDRTTRQFGPKMMIGYIPDPFGHPNQTPQILRGFGIETSCLWRGLDEEPAEFWWAAPDGSRVLMVYLRESYSNGAGLPAENLPAFAEALSAQGALLAAHSAVSDQLIMLGTDHMEPPPNTSNAIAYANKNLHDTHVIHSTLPQFVAAVQASLKKQKAEIPTVTGELRACRRMHLLPGVLSTRMWIKQRNHACETLMEKWVEPFAAFEELVASGNGQNQTLKHKSEIIRQTWRLLMENHPHDSICGCSVDQVHDEMKVRFDQVEQIGKELARQSLEAIAATVNVFPNQNSSIKNPESAIIVFNPTGQTRTDCVTVSAEFQGNFELVDEQGKLLPYQMLGSNSQDSINAVMSRKELKSGLSMVQEGKILGKAIREVTTRREGNQVNLEVVLADSGGMDSASYGNRMREVEALLADPGVTTFHVRARSVPAAEFLFTADEVPGHGYKTFWLRSVPSTGQPVKVGAIVRFLMPLAGRLARLPFMERMLTRQKTARPPFVIENEYFHIQAAPADGTLTVKDKRSGAIYRGLNRFVDGGDCGDEYNYSPPLSDPQSSARLRSVRLLKVPALSVRSGSVQQTLELHLEMKAPVELTSDRKSRSRQTVAIPIISLITLTSGVPRVDVRTEIDNRARDHRLRVHFPAPFAVTEADHDGHFEIVERKVGVPAFDESWVEQPRPEVPQRAFTDISNGEAGLMIANRGLPEVEVISLPETATTEIALTLLRCVGWLSRDDFATRKGHAGPFMETPGAQMPGRWKFEYSVIPHSGQNDNSSIQQAYAFETPLRAIPTGLHDGNLPSAGSFVKVEPADFVISAIKGAESGNGWLARGYNLTGEEIQVTLKPWKPFKKVERVNLAEEKLAALKPAKDGSVTFGARKHEIVSVMFRS